MFTTGLVGCAGGGGASQTADQAPTPDDPSVEVAAACQEFEQALGDWNAEKLSAGGYWGDGEGELVNIGKRLKEDVPFSRDSASLSTSFSGLASARSGVALEAATSVIEACIELGVDVAAPTELAQKNRDSEHVEPASQPVNDGKSLQREALSEMWSTTSTAEQSATCELFGQSPDALVDGFMESVGDSFDRTVVREFYRSRCP